jgi:integrase
MATSNVSRVRVWVQATTDRTALRLQWHDPDTGRRKSESARTDDPKVAAELAKDKEYELNHGIRRQPAKMSWEQFCEMYTDEKLAGNRPATRNKAGYVFDAFEEHCHPKNLGAVTERMLSLYVTRLRAAGRSPATIAGHLAYLKAALRWAVDQKFLPEMPKIAMPRVPKKSIIRTVTKEEFERLLVPCPDDRWRAFLWTAWYTGMRRTEMFDLNWQEGAGPWVDFGQRRIWIPAAYNKADADQWTPLHPELVTVLGPLREPRGRLFKMAANPEGLSIVFRKIAKRAGVRVTLHDLRRSFGSRLAPQVSAAVLQRLMRHADIKTTLAFYTNVDGALDDAILKA